MRSGPARPPATGSARVNWRKGCHPEAVLAKIHETTVVKPDGSAEFKGFGFLDYEATLFGMVEWPQELASADRGAILSRALRAAAPKGLDPGRLIQYASQFARDAVGGTARNYVLVSTISIDRRHSFAASTLEGCNVRFPRVMPARYARHREQLRERAWETIDEPWPRSLAPVLVSVKETSLFRAAERASDSLDLLRAYWNFVLNQQVGWRWTSTRPAAVNSIVRGPMTTLHLPSGEPATTVWWFNSAFSDEKLSRSWQTAEEHRFLAATRRVRRGVAGCGYHPQLRAAFLRYCRALDEASYSAAFLGLWGVLEQLTVTPPGATYDVTLRRVAFLCRDRQYHREVLENLRRARNDSVHRTPPDDLEAQVFQLKRYVEMLFRFHLGARPRFSRMDEVAAFLDLPTARDSLRRELRLRLRAEPYATD